MRRGECGLARPRITRLDISTLLEGPSARVGSSTEARFSLRKSPPLQKPQGWGTHGFKPSAAPGKFDSTNLTPHIHFLHIVHTRSEHTPPGNCFQSILRVLTCEVRIFPVPSRT